MSVLGLPFVTYTAQTTDQGVRSGETLNSIASTSARGSRPGRRVPKRSSTQRLRRGEDVSGALDCEDSGVGARVDGDVLWGRRGAFDARAGSEQERPALGLDDDFSLYDDDRADPALARLNEGVAGREVEPLRAAGERGQFGASAPLEARNAAQLCGVCGHEPRVRM